MSENEEAAKKWSKIVAKAWADEQYKQRLLDDPATVFAEEGIEVPQGKRLNIMAAKEDELCFILPPVPADLEAGESVEERLAAWAFLQWPF